MQASQFTTPQRTRSPLSKGASASGSTTPRGDRYIPSRSGMDSGMSHLNLVKSDSSSSSCSMSAAVASTGSPSSPCRSETEYSQNINDTLYQGAFDGKILAFKSKAPQMQGTSTGRVLYSQNVVKSDKKSYKRSIPQMPFKTLDAPDIVDDYYLNLLDWGSSNVLAVALSATVYLWNAESGNISVLMATTEENDYVSSVRFLPDGEKLSVGLSTGATMLYDIQTCKRLRKLTGHQSRVSSQSWNPLTNMLATGSQDTAINLHDVSIRNSVVKTLAAHQQEVCGLEWSTNGSQLASGGNDNKLNIWNNGQFDVPAFSIERHTAAVKALAWCPHRPNLLASGGGTADRKIMFWNTSTGACLKEVDANSQVCSIKWSKNIKDELVTSHGYSQNQLSVWNYGRGMTKITDLTGHGARVLHMAESPDGETIVSAAADETLRFWKIFQQPTVASKDAKPAAAAAAAAERSSARGTLRHMNIR